MTSRTLIIAEAGVNHNGDLKLAKRLIDAAAEAGADLVKFQTFTANRLATNAARKAAYQIQATDSGESQLEMLRRLELTPSMHKEIIAYCTKRKIGFFSTSFDIESTDLLVSYGQEQFKIPSGEITNLPYLRHIGQLSRPVILSTGMATMEEIRSALQILENSGTPKKSITVLHCTTEYPTPMADVNLRAMLAIRDSLEVKVGYSDHTLGIEVAIAAVAMGATVIEKHFTLDRNLPGPDHKASLEPSELKSMVAAIRNIEVAMGNGIKRPTPSEAKNMSIVRKSIVARKAIQTGEIFKTENLTTKRPGTGISPMRFDEVLSKKARRNFAEDELIEL
jgi:N,N'-diacetyllegionaminate synthase